MNPPFELDSLLPRNVKAKVNEIIRYLRATKLHVDSSMQLDQNSAGIVLKSRARGGRGGSGSSMSGLFQIDLKTENGSAEISITSADSSNCGFILHHYDGKTPESVTSVEAVKSLSIKNSKVQYLWLKVWKPGENKKPEFEVTEKSAPPEKGHTHFLIAQILRDEKDFIINPCENSALHCWWPDKNAVGPFAVTIDEQAKTVHVAAGYALANGVAFDVPAASLPSKKALSQSISPSAVTAGGAVPKSSSAKKPTPSIAPSRKFSAPRTKTATIFGASTSSTSHAPIS